MRFSRLFLTFYALFCLSGTALASTCAPDLASIHAADGRVNQPVPGLWASIPDHDIDIGTFKTETKTSFGPYLWDWQFPHVHKFETALTVRGEVGDVRRNFDQSKQIMWAYRSDLQIGSVSHWVKIPGVVPLVRKKGIPIQLLVTLMQMKMAGVEYGSLRLLQSNITNDYTQSQLSRAPEIRAFLKASRNERPPNEMIARWFHTTQTYKYFETFLTQSGHRIKNIRVETYSTLQGVGDFSVYLDLEPLAVSN